MSEVLQITDIDQRTQATKFAKDGIRDFYKSQKGKMIDSYEKKDVEGRVITYELWEIPAGEIFNKTVHFTVYECPSSKKRGEKREYTKGVPPFKTIASAMAWGVSDEVSVLSSRDWEYLVPLIEES